MTTKGDTILQLARETIREYVLNGKQLEPTEEQEEELSGQRGVFVSLKKEGKLRGCIGTVESTQKNLAQEIIKNAINASGHDPRFPPVRPEEVDELNISVDVLGKKEPVSGPEELDPKKYGVIVKKGHRSGLLLPDLGGIDTVEKQISVACKKAGITYDEDVQLYRFKVERFD